MRYATVSADGKSVIYEGTLYALICDAFTRVEPGQKVRVESARVVSRVREETAAVESDFTSFVRDAGTYQVEILDLALSGYSYPPTAERRKGAVT